MGRIASSLKLRNTLFKSVGSILGESPSSLHELKIMLHAELQEIALVHAPHLVNLLLDSEPILSADPDLDNLLICPISLIDFSTTGRLRVAFRRPRYDLTRLHVAQLGKAHREGKAIRNGNS